MNWLRQLSAFIEGTELVAANGGVKCTTYAAYLLRLVLGKKGGSWSGHGCATIYGDVPCDQDVPVLEFLCVSTPLLIRRNFEVFFVRGVRQDVTPGEEGAAKAIQFSSKSGGRTVN